MIGSVDFAGINPVGDDLGYGLDDRLAVRSEIAACLIFDAVMKSARMRGRESVLPYPITRKNAVALRGALRSEIANPSVNSKLSY